jgi:exodeoxyribonuclease VII small subunit
MVEKKDLAEVIPVDSLSYEQALNELENIVATLESGEGSLEASLKLFARGNTLARYCMTLLEKAELQIKQITEEKMVPFEPSE